MKDYRVEVDRDVRKRVYKLPGNIRQRVIRALRSLRQNPRPSNSTALDPLKVDLHLPARTELRRIRLEAWRIVYFIEEGDALVSVLAVRKRPPYRYEDLEALMADLLG